MTFPTDEAWAYFQEHHDNIRNVVQTYGCLTYDISDFDDAVKQKDAKRLSNIMNDAWFRAPDKRWIYSVAGFTEMCNLLDCTVDGFTGPEESDDENGAGVIG